MVQLTTHTMLRLASRLAALSLAVAIVALLYTTLAMPLWSTYAEKTEEIGRNRLLLGKYTAISVSATGTPDQQTSAAFCSGKTNALVLAGLQGSLQSIATAEGVSLRSVQPLANVASGPLSLAGLGLDLTGDFAHLQRMIYAVETTAPTLLIRHIEIRRSASISAADVAASAKVDAQLHVYCAVDRKD